MVNKIFSDSAMSSLIKQHDSIVFHSNREEAIIHTINAASGLIENTKNKEVETEDTAFRTPDIILTIIIFLLTIYFSVLWVKRVSRKTAGLTCLRRNHLKEMQIRAFLFFVFVYPFYIPILVLLGEMCGWKLLLSALPAFLMMFVGWIPVVIYFSFEKRKYPRIDFNNYSNETTWNATRATTTTTSRQTTTIIINGSNDTQERGGEQQRREERQRESDSSTTKIFINIATVEEIMSLSSAISVIDANKVIRERNNYGDFLDFSDFQRRTGLPEQLINRIKNNIDFRPSDNSSGKKDGKRVVDF